MSTDQTRDQLAGVLTAPLVSVGLDLEAVELTAAGKRRMLRVAIDKDGGVTMDDIAVATKEVSRVLDETDVMGEHPYTLEVTSPGTDRPLTLPRHWRRNLGRLVKVTGEDGESFIGRITATDEERATVDIDGQEREIGYADVSKARIEIEFKRKES